MEAIFTGQEFRLKVLNMGGFWKKGGLFFKKRTKIMQSEIVQQPAGGVENRKNGLRIFGLHTLFRNFFLPLTIGAKKNSHICPRSHMSAPRYCGVDWFR
ncbi:MAG: hypothetical protein R2791_09495 [Saprospiraceae bacterium]